MTPPRAPLVDTLVALAIYLCCTAVAQTLFAGNAAGLAGAQVEASAWGLGAGLLATAIGYRFFPPLVGWGRCVPQRVALGYVLLLVVWTPLAMWLYPWLLQRFDVALPPQPFLEYFAADASSARAIPVVLVACVLAPWVEEHVFRGFLQPALTPVFGPTLALVATAALFGLMHGPRYALPVGLLGLWFGFLAQRSGGLAAPIAGHALHNSFMVASTYLWPEGFESIYR